MPSYESLGPSSNSGSELRLAPHPVVHSPFPADGKWVLEGKVKCGNTDVTSALCPEVRLTG